LITASNDAGETPTALVLARREIYVYPSPAFCVTTSIILPLETIGTNYAPFPSPATTIAVSALDGYPIPGSSRKTFTTLFSETIHFTIAVGFCTPPALKNFPVG
jgi:hypothetical protein